ncbi:cyclohexanone monooxygenase [Stemphylium lycopersici]|nr:cyclohexanone monooxygenase [Stemphylium lycopersici]
MVGSTETGWSNNKSSFATTGIVPWEPEEVLKKFRTTTPEPPEYPTAINTVNRRTVGTLMANTITPDSHEAAVVKETLLSLQAQQAILEHENNGLRTVRHAIDRRIENEREIEEDKRNRLQKKEFKAEAKLIAEEQARIKREERVKERERKKKEKAAKAAQEIKDCEARNALKAIQTSQSSKRKASKPAAKQQLKKRRVGGARGGAMAEVPAPAPPPTLTRRGRTVNIPAKTTTEAQDSASTRRVVQLTGHLASADETENLNAHPTASINYPPSRLQLDPSRFIDRVRPVKVAVIGAGLAGINAGILLPAKVPGIQLTIFEKNTDVSGTWLENIYPGVRCDIPAHVYQSTFSPNTQWSEIFAKGAEIRDYWQAQAKKYGVYDYVKLQHRVDEAEWDDAKSKWRVQVRDLVVGRSFTVDFDFIITAIGRFNAWKLPDYPGLDDYKGHLRHTSNWDPSFDATDKNVAVIGNGASGIQVVPNLQCIAKRVMHFVRNPTWIATSWAGDERTFEPQPYSEEQRKSLEDPETYLNFRKELEDKYWRRFRAMIRESPENAGMRELFVEVMKKRSAKKPELLSGLIPDFSPHCRRLTPGPGYLESLTEDNVELVKSPIKRFTSTGIETVDGKNFAFDAILCATGANTDLVPPFSIKARGIDLNEAWKPEGKWGFPYTYFGLATPGFPNLFFLAGPHATGPSGTVPQGVETSLVYIAKALRKTSSQGIKSLAPTKEAADDFVDYCDAFFPTTVLTDNCSSWNNGGVAGQRIHGLWPGSAAHFTIARREPRWEDWEYERENKANRFAYFGNGYTEVELDDHADLTSYLQPPGKELDLRDVHESWWDVPGARRKS